ncbi:MAG: Crp/Fnr family transcriptional regulator [Intrasporangium sp.]|uniref:Crp/Fnr family transcriptional regulator n=1 Tax=Intrasporangium sp. TaxID=1925024 RepID=UPI002648B4E5|nr:Crp/Fnr family transcriptional regulator [Intrasporangium sp.]MDN5796000.1 Crp/Fnr family transcriptional regulator [Intrasporangium sp.]
MTHHPTGTSCVAIVPLFAGLTPEEQDRVATYAHPIRRAAGETIHRPGDDVSHLLVVHRGRVKISHLSAGGQERLLRVLEPGDFTGEAAFVTGQPHDDLVVALGDVELCSFEHRELGALVGRFPDIALRMLRTVTGRLDEAERTIADLTASGVEARLAGYLVDLPTSRRDGRMVARLPLPKKDIASLLGTTPETLSRKLAAFVEAGLVEVNAREVTVLDPVGLEARTRVPQSSSRVHFSSSRVP